MTSQNLSAQSRVGALARPWLFPFLVSVIALHVIDDNWLQPPAGTSAADHGVSALVPLMFLAGLAWLHRSARAGIQATTELLAGVCGVVIGTEAVYYLSSVGLSGDDFTGLAAIAAGATSIACAAVRLFSSRKRDDAVLRRILRRSAICVLAAIAVMQVGFPLGVSYVVTHISRAEVPIPDLPAHQDVTLTTSDGIALAGWYIPSQNEAAVIVFAGRKSTQARARMLAEHGYGVLIFDRRGEGESGGDPNMLGWGLTADIDAAVDFLSVRSDVDPDRIGGLGLSVGGELMLQAAASDHRFRAVVSEGAGTRSIRETMEMDDPAAYVESLSSSVVTLGTALLSNKTPPPNLMHVVAEIAPAPVLFLYGEEGQPQEIDLNPKYYEAASSPKQIWEVPGSSHVGGLTAQPQEYERVVVEFFDRHLIDGEPLS